MTVNPSSSNMTIVNEIKTKLAALPAEYQALITGEVSWTKAHPVAAITLSFVAGFAVAFVWFKIL